MRWFECGLCRAPCGREWLCRDCGRDLASRLHPRHFPNEILAEHPLVSFGSYAGTWASCLKLAKSQPFGSIPSVFEKLLLSLATHWADELARFGCDAIVAVPSHPIRGFLQSDLSARFAWALSKGMGIPAIPNFLRYSARSLLYDCSPQKTLGRGQRLDRKRRARFRIDRQVLGPRQGRRILLVDDICATGASLKACRNLLEDTGRSVIALAVLARAE